MFDLTFGNAVLSNAVLSNAVLSNVALGIVLVIVVGPVVLSLADNVFREMAGGLSMIRASDGGLILGLFLTMMAFYAVQGYLVSYFATRVADMFVQTLFPIF